MTANVHSKSRVHRGGLYLSILRMFILLSNHGTAASSTISTPIFKFSIPSEGTGNASRAPFPGGRSLNSWRKIVQEGLQRGPTLT